MNWKSFPDSRVELIRWAKSFCSVFQSKLSCRDKIYKMSRWDANTFAQSSITQPLWKARLDECVQLISEIVVFQQSSGLIAPIHSLFRNNLSLARLQSSSMGAISRASAVIVTREARCECGKSITSIEVVKVHRDVITFPRFAPSVIHCSSWNVQLISRKAFKIRM